MKQVCRTAEMDAARIRPDLYFSFLTYQERTQIEQIKVITVERGFGWAGMQLLDNVLVLPVYRRLW